MTEKMKISEPWVSIRYRLIKDKLKDIEFTKEEIEKILGSKDKGLSNINEFISILIKEGLLKSRQHPDDARKTLYKLKEIDTIIEHLTKDKLISLLKRGADLIRLRVDYRVLLILLFYKSLSDNYNKKVKEYIDKGVDEEDAYHLVNIEFYSLYDEAEHKLFTWEETAKDKVRVISNFINSFNALSDLNEKLSDLKILIEKLGFNSLLNNEDNFHIFLDLVDLFNKVNFAEAKYDVIGAGYEWILSYFASLNVKEGELYTPKEVIRLMVQLLDIKKDSDVLDPASGSNSMLLEAYHYVSEHYNDGKTLHLEAQESNDITAILGKLNLFLHNIYNFSPHTGDSLTNPKFKEADYVLANPPWNQSGYDDKKLNREDLKKIYEFGAPSKQSADWAWVQSMNHKARKKVAVILDSGALFRGGKEQAIRKKFLDEDLIDTVILLPEKLFYNTMAPGIILILNKAKPKNRKNKTFFVNMSETYIKHPEVRKLNSLSDDNIKKCVGVVLKYKEEEGFSKDVDVKEIEENEFSLNVSLYAYPKEEAEHIDLNKEYKELKDIKKQELEVSGRINDYIEKILKVTD